MKRINLEKKFKDLTKAEEFTFFDNVKRTVFRYVSGRANDDELAHETINDAYMKAIVKADKDVTLRSLRSYIGTIAWNMLYHKKMKKNPFVVMDTESIPREEHYEFEEEKVSVLTDELKRGIQELNIKDKARFKDLVSVGDYKKLEVMWGMSNAGVRQVVFKLRKKIKKYME